MDVMDKLDEMREKKQFNGIKKSTECDFYLFVSIKIMRFNLFLHDDERPAGDNDDSNVKYVYALLLSFIV